MMKKKKKTQHDKEGDKYDENKPNKSNQNAITYVCICIV